MRPLQLREKVGYGLGDAASNIVFQVVINYMLLFYTDVFGISAVAAGTLLLVVRIFDAITDPLMGGIADRTRTKWGRYRPYLLWMSVPYAIFAVLAFTTPELSPSAKLLYAYVTYALLMTFYTAINIPYSALGGVITADAQERASVQSWRFVMAMLGGALVTAVLPLLVSYFGGEDSNTSTGYSRAMVVMSLIALCCFIACFFLTSEKIDLSGQANRKQGMLRDLALVFKNDQWLIIALVTLILLTSVAMKGAVTPYFVNHYLNSESMLGTFVSLSMLAGMAGALCTNWLSRRVCKVSLMRFAAIGITTVHLALFFVPANALFLALSLAIIANFVHMIFIPLLFSTIADTVDYSFIKFGRGALGMSVSAHLFSLKAGIALGGALTGWILGYYGYQANTEQSETTLIAIRCIFALSPFIAGLALFLLMSKYKLNQSWLLKHKSSDNDHYGETNE